jgi:hypothetical protein
MSEPSRAELPIIEATLDLIRWFIPLLNRLPRSHKFALGSEITQSLYGLLRGLVKARYSREKLPLLEPLSADLDLLQIHIRLLLDFQLLHLERYEHASRLLQAVSRQLSGWIGQQRRQTR